MHTNRFSESKWSPGCDVAPAAALTPSRSWLRPCLAASCRSRAYRTGITVPQGAPAARRQHRSTSEVPTRSKSELEVNPNRRQLALTTPQQHYHQQASATSTPTARPRPDDRLPAVHHHPVPLREAMTDTATATTTAAATEPTAAKDSVAAESGEKTPPSSPMAASDCCRRSTLLCGWRASACCGSGSVLRGPRWGGGCGSGWGSGCGSGCGFGWGARFSSLHVRSSRAPEGRPISAIYRHPWLTHHGSQSSLSTVPVI